MRGNDLSNISFIQGDTGWIVFDPLLSTETAKAASTWSPITSARNPSYGAMLPRNAQGGVNAGLGQTPSPVLRGDLP